MLRTYAIYCENTQTEKEYPFGTTLAEIAADQHVDLGFPVLGAMVQFTEGIDLYDLQA